MLLHSKDYYRQIAEKLNATLGVDPNLEARWRWGGAGDYPYTHFFQKGSYATGFTVLDCSEDCLTNGDLEFLAKNGMTCDAERLKALSKQVVKRLAKTVAKEA